MKHAITDKDLASIVHEARCADRLTIEWLVAELAERDYSQPSQRVPAVLNHWRTIGQTHLLCELAESMAYELLKKRRIALELGSTLQHAQRTAMTIFSLTNRRN